MHNLDGHITPAKRNMANVLKLDPKPTNRCFGCGAANPAGMKLSFDLDLDAQRARGSFILGPNYAGGGGFAHGGIIAVVLDEAMGKISRIADEKAVTAEMDIRDQQGNLLARGKGRFVLVDASHFAKADATSR